MGYFAGGARRRRHDAGRGLLDAAAAGAPKSIVTGTVTDDASKAALAGAVVSLGGHASSPGFTEYLAATTDAKGVYKIPGVYYGTYHDVSALKAGYDSAVETVDVRGANTTKSFALRSDWAAGPVAPASPGSPGPDFTPYGCGPGNAIDQSLGNGWGQHVRRPRQRPE